MAGTGGGASAVSTVPDYIQNMHGLLLQGYGSISNKNWANADSATGALSRCDIILGGANFAEGDTIQVGYGGDGVLTVVTVLVGEVTEVEVTTPGSGYLNGQVYTGYKLTGSGTGNLAFKVYVSDLAYESDGTFLSEPSVLRWLIERGLTDTGHNPFVLQDSYDPDTDLALVQTELDTYKTNVAALDQATDFGSAVSTALVNASAVAWSIDAATELDTATTRALSVFNNMLTTYTPSIISLYQSTHTDANYIASRAISEMIHVATETLASEVIDEAVVVYRQRALIQHLRDVNSFAGGMADINAVNSSAFIIGMANMTANFGNAVTDYRTKLALELYDKAMTSFVQILEGVVNAMPSFIQTQLQGYLGTMQSQGLILVHALLNEEQNKQQFVAGAVNTVMNALGAKTEHYKAAAIVQADVARMTTVLKKEQLEANLEIDTRETLWDLELFQKSANILSAINGGVVAMPTGPTRTQSAMGGMLSGASAGMKIGSMIPGVGTAVGTGIGALAGLVAGAN